MITSTTIRLSSTDAQQSTSKIWENADKAVADVKSGSTILSAGFGLCGTAGSKLHRLRGDIILTSFQKRSLVHS